MKTFICIIREGLSKQFVMRRVKVSSFDDVYDELGRMYEDSWWNLLYVDQID